MRTPICLLSILVLTVATLAGCSPEAVEQTLDTARSLVDGAARAAEPEVEVEPPPDGNSLGPESATRLYYQFVDQRGRVRFVERLDDVPEEWRGRVGFVEMSVPPPLTPGDARRTRDDQYAGMRRTPGIAIASTSAPPTVLFYSAQWCGWCRKAKSHMDGEGIRYELRDIDTPSALQELVAKTGQKGIPAFDVNGRILTGFDPEGLERLIASM